MNNRTRPYFNVNIYLEIRRYNPTADSMGHRGYTSLKERNIKALEEEDNSCDS